MSGIPIWAVRGAKVVCVGTTNAWKWTGPVPLLDRLRTRMTGDPVTGRIYTITAVVMDDGYPCLVLKGFSASYVATYFRPLITQQDDIEAHFRALLNVPAKVEA